MKPGSLRVELSKEARAEFANLYHMIKKDAQKGAFDPEVLLSLKEFATYPQTSLLQLLLELPQIAQQCEGLIKKTGNYDIHPAVLRVISSLGGEDGFTLFKRSPVKGA